jgi:hypothetical protein
MNYTDYIRDKRVIIVGPAPNIKGKNLGAKIDRYDVVIRLNRWWLIADDPAINLDYGTKADVYYINSELVRSDMIENLMNYVNEHTNYAILKRKLPKIIKTSNCNIEYVKNCRDWLIGNYAIKDVLSRLPYKLDIAGITCYSDSNKYVADYSPNFNFEHCNNIHHTYPQLMWLNNQLNNKTINHI